MDAASCIAGKISVSSQSLSSLYLTSWFRPDVGVNAIKSKKPSESTLLSLVMIGCIIQLLGNIGAILLYGEQADQYQLILAAIVAILFFLPLIVYGISWGVGKICNALGGRGTLFETRIAVFWVFVLVSPLIAFSKVFLSHTMPLSIFAGCAMAYLASVALKTVHQFQSLLKVMTCVLIVPVLLGILAWFMNGEILQ
jgi:hypothetical protein